MDRTDFVSEFRQLYTDIRNNCHGSIVFDGENLTRADDDDPPWVKPSIKAANRLFDLFGIGANVDLQTAETMIAMMKDMRDSALKCQEINAVPTTNPKADCRPIITIDANGWPSCEWRR
jgi:hypothetical protein